MSSTFANFIVFYKLSDSTYRTYNYNNQQFKTIKVISFSRIFLDDI